jgi:NitT/TauT family transport system permease protein
MLRLALIAAVFAAWQFGGWGGTAAYYVSTSVQIVSRLIEWTRTGEIWPHLAATATTTAVGFALAAVAAILLALAFAGRPHLARLFEPFLFAAFSTPKVVVAPLLILWIGVGAFPVTALAAISCFFIIFYGAYGSLRDTSRAYLDTAAILGAGPWRTAFQFRMPAAAPFILASLQQGLIYAFHGSILGEMTASDTGMGYLIIYSATSMDSTSVLAALVVIGAVSSPLVGVLGRATQAFSAPLAAEAVA